MSRRRYDVAVVGAGPAGSACALALARSGCRVVLLGREPERRGRGELCGAALFRRLAAVGAASCGEDAGFPVDAFRTAWGASDLDGRSLRFWELGPARAVDRGRFDARLVRAAVDAGAERYACDVRSARRRERGWEIGLADGDATTLDVGFVVEATGRGGSLLFQPGARVWFDRLVCLFAEADDLSSDESDAVVESVEGGWWFAVPVAPGRRVVAMFTDADLVPRRSERGAWFEAELCRTTHVRSRARLSPSWVLGARDARTGALPWLWRDRWACAGDAAWSLDPLSGDGIARAVASGLGLADAVRDLLSTSDVGAVRAYALGRARALRDALETRARFYSAERRWPEATFWRRRHASPGRP